MKKTFRFYSILLLIMVLTVLVSGCTRSDGDDLYDRGLEVAEIMDGIVKSESYCRLLSGSDSIDEFRKQKLVADDYDSPTHVYSITVPSADELLGTMGEDSTELYNELSDLLKEQIDKRIGFNYIINTINAKEGGTTMIAASSLYNAVTSFDNVSLSDDIAYLYVFEDGMPIIVVFTAGENGVGANGYFMFKSELSDISDVKELFEPFGCEVNRISD